MFQYQRHYVHTHAYTQTYTRVYTFRANLGILKLHMIRANLSIFRANLDICYYYYIAHIRISLNELLSN